MMPNNNNTNTRNNIKKKNVLSPLLGDIAEETTAAAGDDETAGDGELLSSSLDYGTATPTTNKKKDRRSNNNNNDRSKKKKSIATFVNDLDPGVRKFDSNLYDDLVNFREGSIPQSCVLAVSNALVCGIGCYLYYLVLEHGLEFFWKTLPEDILSSSWPSQSSSMAIQSLWIPCVGMTMALCLGITVAVLGEPGDLAYTIQHVHQDGFIHLSHVVPMVVASLFSIVGGGSVGPEAPLIAICAALGGNLSKYVFKQSNKNVLRKHTLMSMSGALAAFFGSSLGGSLFALEVCSKFGIEYFEHAIESILCGVLTMIVFRWLTGIPIGPIWTRPYDAIALVGSEAQNTTTPLQIIYGGFVGLLGAMVGAVFVTVHWQIVKVFQYYDLFNPCHRGKNIARCLVGGIFVCGIGMLVPHTMFWGEMEFNTIYNLSNASTLPHVYPTSGLLGFEMNSVWTSLVVGFAKLFTISFSVAGGYRGGFIFPLFTAGCAFGRALIFVFPASLSSLSTITCLCFAAGLNVAITKTSMATTLILVFLSGEENAISAVLLASLVSLMVTSYMPFIHSQISREDELHSELELIHGGERAKRRWTSAVRKVSIVLNIKSAIDELKEENWDEDEEEEGPGVEDVPLANIAPSIRRHTARTWIV